MSLSVVARVFDLGGGERYAETFSVDVGADASARAGKIPVPVDAGKVSFVELEVRRGPDVVSINTYWVPARADVLNPAATTFVNTPTAAYADLSALTRLARARVGAVSTIAQDGADTRLSVVLDNPGADVAFFVHLTLRAGPGGPAVVPVFWDDNYVTLRPGTRRTLTVTAARSALGNQPPVVDVEGINVARAIAE